jgi:hypothetical protein
MTAISGPRMSVVIPNYNHGHLIEEALLAISGQTMPPAEVVVVDDGSTDGTATKLAAAGEPRLRVIRHEQPRGQAAARNTGIAAARTSWLAFLDDDDLWSPRKLRVQLDTARLTGADFVYAGAVLVYEDGAVLSADPLPNAGDLSTLLVERDVIPAGASNIVARTELIRGLGGFDQDLPYSADWELWIRVALAAQGAACSEVLVAHFKHRGGDLFRSRRDVVAEFDRVVEKHAGDIRAGDGRHGRRALAEWLVHEHREAGFSRARAYLGVVRAQPTVFRAVGTASDLARERLRRLVAAAGRRSADGADTTGRDAVAAPDWLRLYLPPPEHGL